MLLPRQQSAYGCKPSDELDSTLRPALEATAGDGIYHYQQGLHTPTGAGYRRNVRRTLEIMFRYLTASQAIAQLVAANVVPL